MAGKGNTIMSNQYEIKAPGTADLSPAAKRIIAKLRPINEVIEELHFEEKVELSRADLLAVAEEVDAVVSGGLTFGWKHGMSEVCGLGLYGAVVRGEKLTPIEIIRQLLNASTCPEAFAAALRRLADEIERADATDKKNSQFELATSFETGL